MTDLATSWDTHNVHAVEKNQALLGVKIVRMGECLSAQSALLPFINLFLCIAWRSVEVT